MNRTDLRRIILTFLALLAGSLVAHAAEPSFDAWSDEFAARWVKLDPELATQVQYFSGDEQDALDRQLTLGISEHIIEAKVQLAHEGLAALEKFPAESLSPMQRTSAAIIRWNLQRTLSGAKFVRQRFVFTQFRGAHLRAVDLLTNTHPIRRPRDVENYLARLALVAPRLDEGIAQAEAAEAAGVLPPRFILERVLEQLDGFLALPPDKNVFVTSLMERMTALGATLSPADKAAWSAAAEREVRESILPVFGRIRALIARQLPRATAVAGASQLPDGPAYYADALEERTTTHLTADEIHAIGEREVEKISAEMEILFRKLGYTEGSLQSRIEKLDATLAPPAGPNARAAVLAKVESVMADADRRSAVLFGVRPQAPVIVKREPELSEKSAAAHYNAPAPDGSRPGIYWIPLPDLALSVPWLGSSLKTTTYHEAIPGHHFQFALQQESTELPRFRRLGAFGFNSAFVEGWALYAERLALENGWYDGDLPGQLGCLSMQLFRARRLVADTSLHSRGWTREQVIAYGFPVSEAERYVVWPGQACSYMIGQLKILELRERARTALGPKFSIQAYHQEILRGGCVPLEVLDQNITAWIEMQKK